MASTKDQQPLAEYTFALTRADLVQYAGASGDFNPIHYSDHAATAVGLPGVIAHGMYTKALAMRAVSQFVGDPGALISVGCRFTGMVPVSAGEASVVTCAITEHSRDDQARTVTYAIDVRHDGQAVLGKARAVCDARRVQELAA